MPCLPDRLGGYIWGDGHMNKLIVMALAIAGLLAVSVIPLQAQDLTATVRDAVISAVKEKTGRTLSINGALSFSMQPSPHMTAKQVVLSNPQGFEGAPFISMDQIDVSFDLVAALTGTMVINGFVMEKPVINLMVNKDGRNNWSFGTKALQAGVFEISNGLLTYSDAQKNTEYTFKDVNLKISAPQATDPLVVTGNLMWKDDRLTLAASFATLEVLNANGVAKINIRLSGQRFSTDLSGNLTRQKDGLDLTRVVLLIDDMEARGKMSFKYGKARPYLAANFKLDRLNLTPYLGGMAGNTTKTTTGWSKAEMDFSSLRAMDGTFTFSTDSVIYENISTGAASLSAKLRKGVLQLNLPRLALYGGSAKMYLSIDSSRPKAAFKLKGSVRNVNALPFLRDAANIRKIEGRTYLGFNLASTGSNQHAIMKALKGNADVNFRKGALLGINISRILRSIQKGKTSGFARGGKTPFGKIVAKFRFRKGVGTNKRFRMSGGEVLIYGGGTVRMPNRTLGYRVHPSLVGRGGISVLGINVPIIISGPWANPRVYPDLPGFLDTPQIALKGLATVGKSGVKGVAGVVGKVTSPIGNIIKAPFKKLF